MKLVKTGLRPLDKALGGVREKSLILLHEEDPRSLGKLMALEVLREKLDGGHLVGYFNLGMPISVLFELFDKMGIDYRRAFDEDRFFLVDTFGSIYGQRVDFENVQYLRTPVSLETLNDRYIEVIREHKRRWAEKGMFEGRELWGITVSNSDYKWIFGEEPTLRYLELVDAQRHTADVYRKYPSGTNLWVYSGVDRVILPFLYRKADYVLKTGSSIEGDKVVRNLIVVKAPELEDILSFEYAVRDHRIIFEEF
ncbi:MAG: hypothetical protein PWQ79_601 [Thermococcaceae archaeon]|nr:hypothetical protein [Thermococcaceae archaeon]MDK2913686.1 hypothetical protein [Thermococcaceae archaeon]